MAYVMSKTKADTSSGKPKPPSGSEASSGTGHDKVYFHGFRRHLTRH